MGTAIELLADFEVLCPKVGDGLKQAAYHGGVERRRQSQRERLCRDGGDSFADDCRDSSFSGFMQAFGYSWHMKGACLGQHPHIFKYYTVGYQ
jgi:hypothetical protein